MLINNYHFMTYCKLFSELLHVEPEGLEERDMLDAMDWHWNQLDEKEKEFVKEYSMQNAKNLNLEACALHAQQMQEKLKEMKMT